MNNLPGKIERTVSNTFGLRTWIGYGFKQAKDELGWADYRLTDSSSIERWWELVMCAYLLVSLQAPLFAASAPVDEPDEPVALPTPTETRDRRPQYVSIPPGPKTPVGRIASPTSRSSYSSLSAPASWCRGCALTPYHNPPPVSRSSVRS